MSDSYSKYMDDLSDYRMLCKVLKIKPKELLCYEHLTEIKALPCVIWKDYCYQVDFKNFPEYKL